MTKINKNAIELLKSLTTRQDWDNGAFSPALKHRYRTRVNSGKLSYEKACEILEVLGYEKVKEETWKKQKSEHVLDGFNYLTKYPKGSIGHQDNGGESILPKTK